MNAREEAKFNQMERDLKRSEDEREKLSKRIVEANDRLREQWDHVKDSLTKKLQVEQQLDELRKELKHAHAALLIYETAGEVMRKAGYEVDKIRNKR